MFKGTFVAVITPFTPSTPAVDKISTAGVKKIDRLALERHVNWLIESGVDGIVACGTTGEAATLSPREYAEIVRIVTVATRKRCPVIAGAGANSTVKAIELAKMVIEAGAEATLQVTPYYNKPTQEGLYQHFKAIASEVHSPHILYNVPGRTGVNMLPETVEKLCTIKNIIGIKEASGDLKQIETIREKTPNSFALYSGNDDQNLEIYKRGGCGAISVTANIAPQEVSKIGKLFEAGKISEAEKTDSVLEALNKILFIESNPIPVKTALSLMGRCQEEFRLPLTTMNPNNKKRLEETLKHYKLI